MRALPPIFALVSILTLLATPGVAADHRATTTPGYVTAPEELLGAYYARQLEQAPVTSLSALETPSGQQSLTTWLHDHFTSGHRMLLFVTSTSEADRRFGRYFVIATAGLGDRLDEWTTTLPFGGGNLSLSGVSVVHLRQTGRVGERFLHDARRGEALLGCNLHPDAAWTVDVDERRSEATLTVALTDDAPSRMHSVFQDCEPVDPADLAGSGE